MKIEAPQSPKEAEATKPMERTIDFHKFRPILNNLTQTL